MPRRRTCDRFAIDALISQRCGVVRASELLQLGMAQSTITYRARAGGSWQRLLPGIIYVHTGPIPHRQRATAALLFSKGGSMLTGVTALRAYGVRSLPADDRIYVLVPHRRQYKSTIFAVLERTRRLPSHRNRDNLPCAPIARATVDAARRLRDENQVRGLIAEVVQRRMCTVRELAIEIRDAQIRGTALPRRVLREVSAGVRSVAEGDVRRIVERAGVAPALWNHDLFDDNGVWLGCPDAVWPELGVVLEVDSLEWHLSPASYRKTLARHRRMTAVGILVIHVTPGQARDGAAAFLADITGTLAAASARPAPRLTARPTTTAAA